MKNTLRLCLATICMLAAGCSDSSSPGTQTDSKSVVLYTSVDDAFAKLVADAFTQQTGIAVQIVGDTEATKTTGLVTRIQAEMNQPVADVWWSSEPMGTILLDQSGALEQGAMIGMVPTDWPTTLHGEQWSWVGIAMRSRVIAYASDRVQSPPTTMSQLASSAYKGKIGMARPQFGTTRIHMAALADQWGIESFTDWLEALKANNIRLYDGNARVVQAIAMGEIDIGLTDTDDVWAGQENGWKVELIYDAIDLENQWKSIGPTLIPNTVAVIQDAPNPEFARQLAEFLVSPTTERLLYESTTHNTPIHASLREEFGNNLLPIDGLPDFIGAASMVREAMDACEQVLISP